MFSSHAVVIALARRIADCLLGAAAARKQERRRRRSSSQPAWRFEKYLAFHFHVGSQKNRRFVIRRRGQGTAGMGLAVLLFCPLDAVGGEERAKHARLGVDQRFRDSMTIFHILRSLPWGGRLFSTPPLALQAPGTYCRVSYANTIPGTWRLVCGVGGRAWSEADEEEVEPAAENRAAENNKRCPFCTGIRSDLEDRFSHVGWGVNQHSGSVQSLKCQEGRR